MKDKVIEALKVLQRHTKRNDCLECVIPDEICDTWYDCPKDWKILNQLPKKEEKGE